MLSTEVPFVGWFRRGRASPWERLAEGQTYGDAWGALLDRLPAEGQGGESCTLPAGRLIGVTAARKEQPT